MGVSYETIIQKLSEQIEHAKHTKENPQIFMQHISQIHLMCELIIDENKTRHSREKLLSSTQFADQPSVVQQSLPNEQAVEETELKGDSIFDF